MAGRLKPRVFPEPVSAIPITSLPELSTGQQWDWISVGSFQPRTVTYFITSAGMLADAKSLSGVTFIPSMWTFAHTEKERGGERTGEREKRRGDKRKETERERGEPERQREAEIERNRAAHGC